MKIDPALLRRSTWLLFFVLACAATISGCRGGKQMYRVRGKVAYKDGSVPKGSVAVVLFSPVEGSTAEVRKGASGSIEPDGSFEMVTRMPGDGVNAGTYAVTFRVLRESANGMVNLVAPKYSTPMTPAFTETVDRDLSDLKYEIERAEGVSATAPATTPTGPGSGPGT